jgi:uncharacterized protein
MGIWEGLKRGSKALAEGDPPARYFAGGKQIVCEHCGHEEFDEGSALLNTAGMSFMNLDWANKSATTLMCDACGRIHWYGIKPDRQ